MSQEDEGLGRVIRALADPFGRSGEETIVIAADARERLARHLYIEASPEDWRPTAELAWDRDDPRVRRGKWLSRAEEMLAVITRKDVPS